MTIVHWLQMRLSIVFHLEFHLDDVFWEIVVGLNTVAATADVAGASGLNEVEAEVAVRDTPNAVTVSQMVDQYSHDYHQLRAKDMKFKVNYFVFD